MSLGVIDQPLGFLLYNPSSVILTLAHAWAAVAILPIYVSLEKIDRRLIDLNMLAADELGWLNDYHARHIDGDEPVHSEPYWPDWRALGRDLDRKSVV